MSRFTVRHRGRSLVALTASLGLAAGVPTLALGAAQAVAPEPVADCAAAYPVDELAAGQQVDGLTVVQGATPTGFTGEVLGVLEDGIAPDVDMVLARLDSPTIGAVGGIWQGMSGSPVYAADGRLIGAVAYGLSYGSSPVAGITPFADMDDYLAPGGGTGGGTDTPPREVAVDRATARSIAARTDVSAAQAEQGLSQLAMPLTVTGVRQARLDQADDRRYLTTGARAGGRVAAADSPGAETMVAGGNMAASLSYGDVTAAGVGTATSVCDGRVVGFGHPMAFAGDTTMGLHTADAIYVQEDSLGAPFKVANIGAPVGTVGDDRLTGITGGFGALPESLTVRSSVTLGERGRVGTTQVSVPSYTAQTVFFQNLANHDRVIDGIVGGSELQTNTVSGTDADGRPFSITYRNRFASSGDVTFSGAYDLPDVAYTLGELPGVTLDEVSSSAAVTRDARTFRVAGLQQWRGGAWVGVSRNKPATAVAGRTLRLRTVLRSGSETVHVPRVYDVPKRASGYRGEVTISGGAGFFDEEFYYEESAGSAPDTVAEVAEALRTQVRNDQVSQSLSLRGRGQAPVRQSTRSAALPRVVEGYAWARVVVR